MSDQYNSLIIEETAGKANNNQQNIAKEVLIEK
jgi:hypothetical protein